MQKRRFREEQIIGILQEVDAGATIREVCRRHGMAETTYYRWRTKYGRMDVNEARRLKQVKRSPPYVYMRVDQCRHDSLSAQVDADRTRRSLHLTIPRIVKPKALWRVGTT